MKQEAIGHTKMRRLCRYLNIPLYQAVGILELLWKTTEAEAPAGDIGKLSNDDIATALDYRGDDSELIDALVRAGWLDRSPIHRLQVHDWASHCADFIHTRLARSGLHFADGSVPKLTRLNADERSACAQKYSLSAQDPGLSAQNYTPNHTQPNQTQPPDAAPRRTAPRKGTFAPAPGVVTRCLEGINADEAAAARIWNECRTADPNCTPREVAWACTLKNGPQIMRAENPVGLLISTVPRIFERGGSLLLQQFRAGEARKTA